MSPLFYFCWMWIFPWIKLSWHYCSMWDKVEWFNWLWQFLSERLSSFTLKDFITHMHGLTVYMKEGFPFVWDLSVESSAYSYLCFQLTSLHSVSDVFCLYWSPSLAWCTIFCSILSNIDDVLSVKPSANEFVFGDIIVHYKDLLTFSGGTVRNGELCSNFSISNDFTQMIDFPTQIPDCDSHSPALLGLFLLMLVFVLQWVSFHWKILIMFFVSFLCLSDKQRIGMPCFIA